MTYLEIMARWKRINRRMWTFFIMPVVFIPAFLEFAAINSLPVLLPWVGLVIAVVLATNVYGNLADELIAVSSLMDDAKLDRLIEDLGTHAEDIPLMKVVSNQELGNFRFPSRFMLTIKGVDHLIAYDWEKRRFSRYKWPILPYSIDKTIERAKPET